MSEDKAPPTKLYTALLAAMKVCGPVKKNAINPHLKNKYADLQSVLDTIEGPLWDHGLLIVQRFGYDTEQPVLFTEVIHAESGERITSMIPVVGKDPTDPQKMGGAITYYRRYSLLALLGLAPEDDDGNAASKPPPPRKQEQPTDATSAQGMRLYPGTGAARSSAPASAPAPSDEATVNWTDVWLTAKKLGINDRAALAHELGVPNATALDPGEILAKLRAKLPAGIAG